MADEFQMPVGLYEKTLFHADRLDLDKNDKLSVQESLAASPKQLSGIIREAVDKDVQGVNLKKIVSFIKKIADQDKNLARSAMKDFSEWAKVSPQRLALLEALKGTDLYFKPEEKHEETPEEIIQAGLTNLILTNLKITNLSGNIETHPQSISSNGSPLPQSKEETYQLYRESVPKSYQRFVQLKIFENNPMTKVGRYAPQDKNTEQKIEKALNDGLIDPQKHIVVVDSGGPHSIAMARALAKKGYLIIPHFNHRKTKYAQEDIGGLIYFAKELSQLNRATVESNPQAPWALIIDAHQNDLEEGEFGKLKLGPILMDKDVPLIPAGYGVIAIMEGNAPIQPATKYEGKFVQESIQIASERGVSEKNLWILGLDPYSK